MNNRAGATADDSRSLAMPYPRSHNRLLRALGAMVLRLAGWRVEGSLPPIPKFVLIVGPHTSNWDFIFGLMAKFAVDLRANWLGKHTLFRFPLGPLLRWLGGEPVNRSAPQGTVGDAIELFRTHDQFVLAIAPEGTRKPVPRWKTGFHRIARGAGVPIVPVWLDYRARAVRIGEPFEPGPDEAADISVLRGMFTREMARFPERFVEEQTVDSDRE
ncbi:MAG: lysophospholipid acyltransferase family protein [Gemmatimonadales bacterium]